MPPPRRMGLYCSNCNKLVRPEKPFYGIDNVLVRLALTVGLIISWLIIPYFLYWLVAKKRRCPICHQSTLKAYCPNCQQFVRPEKPFSISGFILGLGVLYLLYWAYIKDERCPICHL
ncbi:MAG: hypothetical protein ACE5GD_09840 [Candidatus Geothermarchaeales archaeon]